MIFIGHSLHVHCDHHICKKCEIDLKLLHFIINNNSKDCYGFQNFCTSKTNHTTGFSTLHTLNNAVQLLNMTKNLTIIIIVKRFKCVL